MDPDFIQVVVIIGGAVLATVAMSLAQLFHEKAMYYHDLNQREAEKHCANMACGK